MIMKGFILFPINIFRDSQLDSPFSQNMFKMRKCTQLYTWMRSVASNPTFFFLLEKSCTMPNNTQEMGKYSKNNFFEILRHHCTGGWWWSGQQNPFRRFESVQKMSAHVYISKHLCRHNLCIIWGYHTPIFLNQYCFISSFNKEQRTIGNTDQ